MEKLDVIAILGKKVKLTVKAPYNEKLIEETKKLNGMWNKEEKIWEFDTYKEKEVEYLIQEIWGNKNKKLLIQK